MDKHYTVALTGAADLPPARRIALETRFAQELEGFLGSPKVVKDHLIATAIVADGQADGLRLPGDTQAQVARLDRAIEAAEQAVWASMGKVPGAAFHLYG